MQQPWRESARVPHQTAYKHTRSDHNPPSDAHDPSYAQCTFHNDWQLPGTIRRNLEKPIKVTHRTTQQAWTPPDNHNILASERKTGPALNTKQTHLLKLLQPTQNISKHLFPSRKLLSSSILYSHIIIIIFENESCISDSYAQRQSTHHHWLENENKNHQMHLKSVMHLLVYSFRHCQTNYNGIII